MVQLKLLNGNRAGTDFVASHFPITIGRSSANDFRLTDPGVWDHHFEIHLNPPAFDLTLRDQALATVNDSPVQHTELRNGDQIGIGSLKIQFTLSPTSQRNLRWMELLVWTLFALLCFGQIVLVYWLPG